MNGQGTKQGAVNSPWIKHVNTKNLFFYKIK